LAKGSNLYGNSVIRTGRSYLSQSILANRSSYAIETIEDAETEMEADAK
jgi:hypothetical protein